MIIRVVYLFVNKNHYDFSRINGDLIRLGVADDIMCEFRNSNFIEFTFNEIETLKYQDFTISTWRDIVEDVLWDRNGDRKYVL